MDEHLEVLVSTVGDLLEAGQPATAAAAVDGLHASDLAEVLLALDRPGRVALVSSLDPRAVAPAVWELEPEDRAETLDWLDDAAVGRILVALPDDGVADLVAELAPGRRPALLRALPEQRRPALEGLLRHSERTAGALMSPDVVSVPAGMPVAGVLETLRARRDAAFIYYVYVLTAESAPGGVISLRELLVAEPGAVVDDVMHRQLVTVSASTDQEEVARLASRYDLLAVPVVDEAGRMLGVVTADDVLEVLSSEADEDVERFVGSMEAGAAHRPRLGALVRARTPWVLGTFVIELGVAYVFLRPLPAGQARALVAFLPLLLLCGGGAAISAAGVVLRRLVRGQTGAALLGREAQGSVLLAVITGAGAAGVLLLAGQPTRLAAVASASVGLTVLVSSVLGSAAPLVLRGLGRDPALASGPLLGAAADAAALAVYLLAARVFL